jgi:hypothetical protein
MQQVDTLESEMTESAAFQVRADTNQYCRGWISGPRLNKRVSRSPKVLEAFFKRLRGLRAKDVKMTRCCINCMAAKSRTGAATVIQ